MGTDAQNIRVETIEDAAEMFRRVMPIAGKREGEGDLVSDHGREVAGRPAERRDGGSRRVAACRAGEPDGVGADADDEGRGRDSRRSSICGEADSVCLKGFPAFAARRIHDGAPLSDHNLVLISLRKFFGSATLHRRNVVYSSSCSRSVSCHANATSNDLQEVVNIERN